MPPSNLDNNTMTTMSLLHELYTTHNDIQGNILLWKKGHGSINCRTSDTATLLANHARQHDWYFHVATHNPDLVKGRGSKQSSQQFTCLWADIDLDIKGDKYPSKAQVGKLIELLAGQSCEPTVVVNSGQGFHIYWLLDKPYNCSEYMEVCRAWTIYITGELRKCTGDDTLMIDGVGDMARVLRIPGTINSKSGTLVEVGNIGKLRKTLHHYINVMSYDPSTAQAHSRAKVKSIAAMRLGESVNTVNIPSYAEHVERNCLQVQNYVNLSGDVREPMWYNMAGIYGYTVDGLDRFCELSEAADGERNTDRSADGANKKIEQWKAASDGPCTCKRLHETEQNLCESCPQWGQITTPIQLGRTSRLIDERKQEPVRDIRNIIIESDEEITDYVPPQPFLINDKRELCISLPIGTAKQSEEQIKVICHRPLMPSKRIWDEELCQEVVYFKIELPHDGWREIVIPLGVLNNSGGNSAIGRITAAGATVPPGAGQYLISFLNKSIRYMQEIKAVNKSYSVIGWRSDKPELKDDRFVLGKIVFYKDGATKQETLTESTSEVLKDIHPKGDLDKWREATGVLGRPGFEPHLLCFLGAFAVPLFKSTEYHGLMVNLVSRDSGTFKSFTLKMLTSIYGKPTFKHLLSRDTPKSVMKKIALRSDLPISYDEITNIEKSELSNLVYSITQGRDQDRLNIDATLRKNSDDWRTVVFSTSNSSMDDVLGNQHYAERMRLLEMSVQHCSNNPPILDTEAVRVMNTISENYGTAGIIWMRHILDNKEKIFEDARVFTENMTEVVSGNDASKRFWISYMALTIYAAQVTKDLGLHSFDIQSLVNYCRDLLKVVSKEIRDGMIPLPLHLSNFLNENLDAVLSMTYLSLNGRKGEMTRMPRCKLIAKIETRPRREEVAFKTAFVSTEAMRMYLMPLRVSYNDFITSLDEAGLIYKKRLSKRIVLPDSGDSTIIKCFSMDYAKYCDMYGYDDIADSLNHKKGDV